MLHAVVNQIFAMGPMSGASRVAADFSMFYLLDCFPPPKLL